MPTLNLHHSDNVVIRTTRVFPRFADHRNHPAAAEAVARGRRHNRPSLLRVHRGIECSDGGLLRERIDAERYVDAAPCRSAAGSSGPGARRASVERGQTIVHQHVDVHCQDLQTTGPEHEQQAEHPGSPGDCHLMFFGCVDQTVGPERVGGGGVDPLQTDVEFGATPRVSGFAYDGLWSNTASALGECKTCEFRTVRPERSDYLPSCRFLLPRRVVSSRFVHGRFT